MKRAPIRGGEVSLLIASGILVVYGGIMAFIFVLGAIALGLGRPSYTLYEEPSIFNFMWLFVSIFLVYFVLGLTLHRGFRPLYFLAIIVVTSMLLWHCWTTMAVPEAIPVSSVAPFIAVNLTILLFLALGYREVESGTVREPFWRMLRDRRSQKEVVCLNCGSHSIQRVRPGEGYCNFCGKLVSFPVGG
jgi:hypothetical protein